MFSMKKGLSLTLVFVVVCSMFAYFINIDDGYSVRPLDTTIDFDGTSVDVLCKGTGSPTVVFEPGLNESHTTFYYIQEEISRATQTFSYDRLSLAYSNQTKRPHSVLSQVVTLHEMLNKLRLDPPYIFVAHSIAGYHARLFAAQYPGEVKGILFIDCSHEDQSFRSLSNDPNTSELCADEIFESQGQLREARKKDALRSIPITVLTADYEGRSEYELMKMYWRPLQDDIASLSDKSRHVLVKDSGHMVQSEHPDVVISEIQSLLRLVRK